MGAEETGWTLRAIDAAVADWEWDVDERHTADPANRFRRYERDYLVTVDGDLSSPRLEDGKHNAYAWVGPMSIWPEAAKGWAVDAARGRAWSSSPTSAPRQARRPAFGSPCTG